MKIPGKLKNISNFSKNVAKVTSGSALAAIISFLGIKFITSLYDPEVMGYYGLLISIITIFSVVASLRYEMAITLPDKEEDRRDTAWVSLIALLIFTVLVGAVLLLAGNWILSFLEAEMLLPYIHLIIFGIFVKGLFQAGQFILLSDRKYKKLSTIKVVQAILIQLITIGYGLWRADLLGLYLGFLIGNLTAGLLSISTIIRSIRQIQLQRLKIQAKRYIKFPTVNSPSTLINSFSAQLPVLVLTKFFGSEVVGYYIIAVKLIDAPMNVISQSVSQVYVKAAADSYNSSVTSLKNTYENTVKKMALVGLGPVIAAAFLSPWFVTTILGEEWRATGYFVQILLVMKFMQFINHPVSSTFSIINRQELALYLTLIFIAIRLAAMLIFRESATSMIWALSIAGALFYITYNLTIYLSIKRLKH